MINQIELTKILEQLQDDYREMLKEQLNEKEQRLTNIIIENFCIDLKYEILTKGLFI